MNAHRCNLLELKGLKCRGLILPPNCSPSSIQSWTFLVVFHSSSTEPPLQDSGSGSIRAIDFCWHFQALAIKILKPNFQGKIFNVLLKCFKKIFWKKFFFTIFLVVYNKILYFILFGGDSSGGYALKGSVQKIFLQI